jgi:hypothetical protein
MTDVTDKPPGSPADAPADAPTRKAPSTAFDSERAKEARKKRKPNGHGVSRKARKVGTWAIDQLKWIAEHAKDEGTRTRALQELLRRGFGNYASAREVGAVEPINPDPFAAIIGAPSYAIPGAPIAPGALPDTRELDAAERRLLAALVAKARGDNGEALRAHNRAAQEALVVRFHELAGDTLNPDGTWTRAPEDPTTVALKGEIARLSTLVAELRHQLDAAYRGKPDAKLIALPPAAPVAPVQPVDEQAVRRAQQATTWSWQDDDHPKTGRRW